MRNPAMQEWLDGYCSASEGVVGGAVMISNPDDGALEVVAEHASSAAQRTEMTAAANASYDTDAPFLSEVNNDGSHAGELAQVVSLPLRNEKGPIGSVALELQAKPSTESVAVAELEKAASAISAALIGQKPAQASQKIQVKRRHDDSSATPDEEPSVAVRDDSSVLLGLQATILDRDHFDEAATAFVTGLASAFHVDRVSIGFLKQSYTSVVAVSGSADFHSKAELFRAIGEAMDESIEQGATICFPDNSKPRITAAHAEFVRRHGGSVCTIPLVNRGRAFGALTLERGGNVSFSGEEVTRVENVACIIGPILELRHQQELPWYEHAWHTVRKVTARMFGRGHVHTKAAVFGGAAVLAALLLIPVEHWVGSPARIEGAIQRSVAAPVDGFLQAAYVKPGDLVVAGQVMAEFAEQDLLLEIRQRQSELAQYENTYSAALVRSDRTQFVIAQAQADEVRAQLGLLEEQLSRSRVLAPFDGIVINGDLSQSIGAPVEKGEVLLTMAPADEFRLIVDVDERDIANIRVDEDGALALAALPNDTLAFKVERITPVANSRDGRNYFEVEGKLNSVPAAMRPGLQGVAKIRSVDRSLLWIWTHRFVDWMRITLWSMGI